MNFQHNTLLLKHMTMRTVMSATISV